MEGGGCVSSGLSLGMFHPPMLPHGCLRRGRSRLLAGHLLPSRHLRPAGFLYSRRGVSSGLSLTCSASPCPWLGDARLLLTPLFFFFFGARAGVVVLLVPQLVPSFGAVVALVTCARLLTPSLPLIPIPTMSAAPVAYRSSCDRKPGISRALMRRSVRSGRIITLWMLISSL